MHIIGDITIKYDCITVRALIKTGVQYWCSSIVKNESIIYWNHTWQLYSITYIPVTCNFYGTGLYR